MGGRGVITIIHVHTDRYDMSLPLHWACEKGQVKVVQFLVEELEYNVGEFLTEEYRL